VFGGGEQVLGGVEQVLGGEKQIFWRRGTSQYRQIVIVIILGVGVQAVEGTVHSQNDVEVDGRYSSYIPESKKSHTINPSPLLASPALFCFPTSVYASHEFKCAPVNISCLKGHLIT
jgi:hypothetical protein